MSELKLHNTLSKKKEVFKSIEQGKVSMYTCGPTVYDYMTIGNFRSYTTADILHRYLNHIGYEVKLIKNITDVGHLTEDDIAQGDAGEDKMLKKARLEKKDPFEIAKFYENAVMEDEKELNILPAKYHPRATEHVPQMIKMIEELITLEHAYESNGNVFFDVATFKSYGKLSGNTLKNLQVGARLADPHEDKRNQWDFALWLKAPDNHLMQWDSPWGRGYPGWHIECSAMSNEYLGDTLDIHTGGEDNIFPHHEAEIAQTESLTHKPFASHWVHTRHLLVDGGKMGKSKGNAYTLKDIKEKGFSAMDLRMVYLQSHYRSQMNFTWESLEQAHTNIARISGFYRELLQHRETVLNSESEIAQAFQKYETRTLASGFKNDFEKAMDDDLNTPESIAVIFETMKKFYKSQTIDNQSFIVIEDIVNTICYIEQAVIHILGLEILDTEQTIPREVLALVKKREHARNDKDFAESDRLRDEIAAAGYIIEDTSEGYTLNKSN